MSLSLNTRFTKAGLASTIVAACFVACSGGSKGPTTEGQAEGLGLPDTKAHTPGETAQEFLARATPEERAGFNEQINTLAAGKVENTFLDYYLCEGYIGTQPYLYNPHNADGGCKYPPSAYGANANPDGGCGGVYQVPSFKYWVGPINFRGSAPATVPACSGGVTLSNFSSGFTVPSSIQNDMIIALNQQGIFEPQYFFSGTVTSLGVSTSDTLGASDAGSGFTGFYDLAQIYGSLTGGSGIPIPTQFINVLSDGGIVPLPLNLPEGADGGLAPVNVPVFQAGNTVGDTMTFWPGNITATIELEGIPQASTSVTCSNLGNVPGWNETPITKSTIVSTGNTCDGGLDCPAANALTPLGAPLEQCAAQNCCSQLTSCVSDQSSTSGCAALANCFVNCETTVITAASGDAAAGTNDIFACLTGCSKTGTIGCTFTAGGVSVTGGCLSSTGGATTAFENALGCVQGAGCTSLPAPDAGSDSGPGIDSGVIGAHPAWPQLVDQGGPVLTTPNVLTVTFNSDSLATELDAFGAQATSSSNAYWNTVRSGYCESGSPSTCVGTGTGTSVALTKTLASSYTDSAQNGASSLQTFIQSLITGGSITVNANTLAMFYLPSTVTITLDGAVSCQQFGGYHNSMTTTGGVKFTYAIIPECGGNTLANTTTAASHEIAEAATDPFTSFASGNEISFYLDFNDPAIIPWNDVFGGEVGDMCFDAFGLGQDLYTESGFTVQRIWSNAAAAAGGDPCVPALPRTYFNTAAESWLVTESVGATTTFEADAFSTAAIPAGWNVMGYDWNAISGNVNPYLNFKLNGGAVNTMTTTNSGQKVSVAVTLNKDPGALTQSAFGALGLLLSFNGTSLSNATQATFWPFLVQSPADALDSGLVGFDASEDMPRRTQDMPRRSQAKTIHLSRQALQHMWSNLRQLGQ